MTDILVRPRAGFILAGVPRDGAYFPKALAAEWARNGLVVVIDDTPVMSYAPAKSVPAAAPVAKPRRTR